MTLKVRKRVKKEDHKKYLGEMVSLNNQIGIVVAVFDTFLVLQSPPPANLKNFNFCDSILKDIKNNRCIARVDLLNTQDWHMIRDLRYSYPEVLTKTVPNCKIFKHLYPKHEILNENKLRVYLEEE